MPTEGAQGIFAISTRTALRQGTGTGPSERGRHDEQRGRRGGGHGRVGTPRRSSLAAVPYSAGCHRATILLRRSARPRSSRSTEFGGSRLAIANARHCVPSALGASAETGHCEAQMAPRTAASAHVGARAGQTIPPAPANRSAARSPALPNPRLQKRQFLAPSEELHDRALREAIKRTYERAGRSRELRAVIRARTRRVRTRQGWALSDVKAASAADTTNGNGGATMAPRRVRASVAAITQLTCDSAVQSTVPPWAELAARTRIRAANPACS